MIVEYAVYGYPAVLLLIVVVCFMLFRRFRRVGWL